MDNMTTSELVIYLSARNDLTERELILLDRLCSALEEVDRLTAQMARTHVDA